MTTKYTYRDWLSLGAAFAALCAVDYLVTTPVHAADLSGDCCSDLEVRVAALESTTVTKGNKKVTLTISGTISEAVLASTQNFAPPVSGRYNPVFDVTQGQADIIQNPETATLFALNGSSKISKDMKIGFAIELLPAMDDGKGSITARDTYVYVDSSVAGTFKLGYAQSAGDGPNSRQVVDLGDVSGLLDVSPLQHALGWSGNRDTATLSLPNLGFQRADEIAWSLTNAGKSGIDLAASYAPESKTFAAAVQYTGKVGTVDILAGIAYENQQAAALTTLAISGGAREEKSGVFIQGAYDKQQGTNATGRVTLVNSVTGETEPYSPLTFNVTDLTGWNVQAGISHNWTGMGDTAIFAEYARLSMGGTTSQPNYWGLGIKQNIDSAVADVFVDYKNYTLDDGNGDVASSVLAGATLHF